MIPFIAGFLAGLVCFRLVEMGVFLLQEQRLWNQWERDWELQQEEKRKAEGR